MSPKSDALQGACVQAEAARQAGKLAMHGATWAAIGSVIAGLLAFVAGAFVLFAAHFQARYTRLSDIAQAAGTFLGEIRAVEKFLEDNDVVGTLRDAASAAAGRRVFFHPGESWTQSYFADPSRLGLMPGDLPTELAFWFSRMRSELGRLIWLHRLTAEEVIHIGNTGLASEQDRSVNNLSDLLTRAAKLTDRLEAERDGALRQLGPLRLVWGYLRDRARARRTI